MFDRILTTVLAMAAMTIPVIAAEPVQLYSAGSLRSALTEVAAAFEQATDVKVQAKFGASGTLKDEIVRGARADVFTSANMEHPLALACFSRIATEIPVDFCSAESVKDTVAEQVRDPSSNPSREFPVYKTIRPAR